MALLTPTSVASTLRFVWFAENSEVNLSGAYHYLLDSVKVLGNKQGLETLIDNIFQAGKYSYHDNVMVLGVVNRIRYKQEN